jgi:hypothetical protein
MVGVLGASFVGGLGGDVTVGTDVFGSMGVGALVPPGVAGALGGLGEAGSGEGAGALGGPGEAGSGEGSVAELGERVGEPAADEGEGAAVDGAIDIEIDIDMSK